MGKKRPVTNILAKKMPEIKDAPRNYKLTLFGTGSLIGEEDVLNRDNYTCSLKCYSLKGTVYQIKKADFMMLRHQDESWLNILEQMIKKE